MGGIGTWTSHLIRAQWVCAFFFFAFFWCFFLSNLPPYLRRNVTLVLKWLLKCNFYHRYFVPFHIKRIQTNLWHKTLNHLTAGRCEWAKEICDIVRWVTSTLEALPIFCCLLLKFSFIGLNFLKLAYDETKWMSEERLGFFSLFKSKC